MRLNGLLDALSRDEENSVPSTNKNGDLGMGRAKQLLLDGKISRKQYDAAMRAAVEASRVVAE
jgi:hypothetical protein